MVRTLYVASSNPGKLRDFAASALARGLSILPLPGLEAIAAPPEDEPTFAGNAKAKAIYYSRFLTGEIVLADDSGLEVDALHGAPGVRSARYAEDAGWNSPANPRPENLTRGTFIQKNFTQQNFTQDERNNRRLLAQLAGVEEARRGAHYTCVLAAARDGRVLLTAEGSVSGRILIEPRGTGGFGYDPLFYLPELDRSMAEIDLSTKDALSHRGKAIRRLLEHLRPLLV